MNGFPGLGCTGKVMEEAPLAVGSTPRAGGGEGAWSRVGTAPGGAQVGPLLPEARGQAVQPPALLLGQFSTKDPSFQLPPQSKTHTLNHNRRCWNAPGAKQNPLVPLT